MIITIPNIKIVSLIILGLIIYPNISLAVDNTLESASQNFKKELSEINPAESLGNVTGPLDNIWKAIGRKLNIQGWEDIKKLVNSSSKPSNSDLQGSLGSEGNLSDISVQEGFGMTKDIFIFIAQILVATLEIALWLIKGVLNIIT